MDFTLASHGGGEIRCRLYEPEGTARAVFQICHGMCEYLGRYERFIAFLQENGFAVIGHDHAGHGHSAATPEDLGYFGPHGDETLVEDTRAVTGYAKERFPGLPVILMGHSMGSFITRAYLTKYGKELDGCIIMGTSGAVGATGAGVLLARLTAKLRGDRYRSPFVKKIAFSAYNKRIPDAKSPNAWLTKDEDVVKKYDKDPFCTYTFTANGFETLFTLLQRVSRADWADGVPKTLPVFLVSGEEDPVGQYGKGVRQVYDRLQKAGADVRMKLYPDCRHEILNEPERETVYRDILAWCEEIL